MKRPFKRWNRWIIWFLPEYEGRFEKDYGSLLRNIKEVVE
jgi:hypothetical protein